jgi:hypothetical protein
MARAEINTRYIEETDTVSYHTLKPIGLATRQASGCPTIGTASGSLRQSTKVNFDLGENGSE